MPRTKNPNRVPLEDRIAADLDPATYKALDGIVPMLDDPSDGNVGKVAVVLTDYAIDVARIVLKHVVPYREV